MRHPNSIVHRGHSAVALPAVCNIGLSQNSPSYQGIPDMAPKIQNPGTHLRKYDVLISVGLPGNLIIFDSSFMFFNANNVSHNLTVFHRAKRRGVLNRSVLMRLLRHVSAKQMHELKKHQKPMQRRRQHDPMFLLVIMPRPLTG